jgi:dCMP deaminase
MRKFDFEEAAHALAGYPLRKWDKYFLDIAKSAATMSKDPSSILGAVAVKDKNILSTGFNGFPRGVKDYSSRYEDRETKLKYIVHAEENCIFNAARNGVSLVGATMYVDGIATCSDCAKGVIQSGINRVVMRYKPMKSHWAEQFKLTQEMFLEANIKYECHEIE